MDELLKQLTPENEHYIFTQPLLFLYRLAAVIQYAKTKQTAIEARQLRSWCLERNLPHASLYKLAVGQSVPTFKAISYLVPYFAPAERLFFTDEEIPYPIRTLPEWNPDDTSVFIQQHKKDWKQIAQKYGIEEENARNIFVNRRANFTLLQMQRMVGEVNPEVWFCKESSNL